MPCHRSAATHDAEGMDSVTGLSHRGAIFVERYKNAALTLAKSIKTISTATTVRCIITDGSVARSSQMSRAHIFSLYGSLRNWHLVRKDHDVVKPSVFHISMTKKNVLCEMIK
jgi:hypothetical protein